MRESARNVTFIGRCLGVDTSAPVLHGIERDIRDGSLDWVSVIRCANEYLVTSILHVELRRKGLDASLPEEVHAYLREIHRLNARRNAVIREQSKVAIAALNGIGVVPAALKSGIRLFEEGWDSGTLMMADFDILVPSEEFARSLRALQDHGYELLDQGAAQPTHACTLFRAGDLATIDLHRDVGPQRSVLTAETALARSSRVEADNLHLRCFRPTDRVLHLLLNFGVFDGHRQMATIPLRQLYDFVSICTQDADSIDWDAIVSVMGRHGIGDVPQFYLALAHRLLGLALPPSLPETMRARLHVWRCLFQLGKPSVMSLARSWARVVHPFNVLRMDYLYGCGSRRLSLYAARLRHAVATLQRRRFERA